MKRSRLLFSILVVALLMSGCGLWVLQAKRQYTLNRQLIIALLARDYDQALVLVNKGADPNTRYALTPAPTLKLLLDQLRHPSPAPANRSSTAFLFACSGVSYQEGESLQITPSSEEHLPLVRAMLAHGADCNATTLFHAGTLVNTISILPYTIRPDHAQTVSLLLEHGANINAQDEDGTTPLMYAVSVYHTNITRLLLERGASTSLLDRQGRSALHCATSHVTNIEDVRLLLAYGADPNLADKNGLTPLMLAQKVQRPDIVALLRKGTK